MIASKVLMVKPLNFYSNPQTAVNNSFQKASETETNQSAQKEFQAFFKTLVSNGINVLMHDESITTDTPDAIFPNNWISFHEDGSAVIYPMFAENRRRERDKDFIAALLGSNVIKRLHDLTSFESEEKFLEGTGSMVLDRQNKIVYACLSPRTHTDALEAFCKLTAYKPVVFSAISTDEQSIYHTNVMMSTGDKFSVICLESIRDVQQRKNVEAHLISFEKEIIDISLQQLHEFCGNVLQLRSVNGEDLLVMSTRAYKAYTENQLKAITQYCRIIHSPLDVIETAGGGSARCMLAEIF